jgi:hypothetical protein
MRRKRKPDLLAVLAFLVGLGVVITGLAQSHMPTKAGESTGESPIASAHHLQDKQTFHR